MPGSSGSEYRLLPANVRPETLLRGGGRLKAGLSTRAPYGRFDGVMIVRGVTRGVGRGVEAAGGVGDEPGRIIMGVGVGIGVRVASGVGVESGSSSSSGVAVGEAVGVALGRGVGVGVPAFEFKSLLLLVTGVLKLPLTLKSNEVFNPKFAFWFAFRLLFELAVAPPRCKSQNPAAPMPSTKTVPIIVRNTTSAVFDLRGGC